MAGISDIAKRVDEKRKEAQASDKEASKNVGVAQLYRQPFIMSCKKWLDGPERKKLAWRANPGQINYSFATRGSKQQVAEGYVFYFFKSAIRKTHWDLPVLKIQFQTGNIRPFIEDEKGEIILPDGIQDFYTFKSLYDEDKMLVDGSPNFITIEHNSNIYPSLVMEGLFDPEERLEYDESAEDGTSITFTLSFYVFSCTPGFNSEAFKSTFPQTFADAYSKNI